MTTSGRPFVIVHGDRRLRAESIISLLGEWKNSRELEIFFFTGALEARAHDPADCRLCIVDVGMELLESVSSRVAVALMHALYPCAAIFVVSDVTSPDEARRLPEAVRGFVSSGTEPAVLVAALDLVLSGGRYVPAPDGREDMREAEDRQRLQDRETPADAQMSARDSNDLDEVEGQGALLESEHVVAPVEANVMTVGERSGARLTPRQQDVLTGLHAGKSNKSIARDLDLSEATVKIHVRQLMRKLGAMNRTQLAVATLYHGRSDRGLGSRVAESGSSLRAFVPHLGIVAPN